MDFNTYFLYQAMKREAYPDWRDVQREKLRPVPSSAPSMPRPTEEMLELAARVMHNEAVRHKEVLDRTRK